MPDTGLEAPYLDPSQYPSYLDAQRKQMVAGLLLNSLQQSNQTPTDWDSMKVVPKRGLMQNIAPLVSALMASRGLNQAQQAQAKYFSGLYGGTQPSSGQTSPAQSLAAGADTTAQSTAQPPSNPLIPAGMPQGQAQMLMGLMGPQKYGEMLAQNYKPAEIQAQLRAAGIDPNSMLGRQVAQQSLAKANYIPPVDVRPGGTLVDPRTGQPTFSAPNNGVQTQWGSNGPVQSVVPGAPQATAAMTGAETGAHAANTPHYEEDPFHPGQYVASYPPTPPALQAPGNTGQNVPHGASQSPGALPQKAPATAADLQGMKSGAESGVTYASELAKNATGATEVRRSLSELKNLANQAGPAGLNEGKMKLGSYMIAAGMSPESVSQFLGVDVGALQAAQKQTATLAVNTIHSMTSRGTNFDLDTFMRNNPNMNMADPAAFNRVVDYMDNKAKQEVAKQADFAEWKKGHTPDEWETGHTAHWLQLQNQNIEAGRSNSRPPLSSFVRP